MKIKSYWIYPLFLIGFFVFVILVSCVKQYVPFYHDVMEFIYLVPLVGAFVYICFLVKWLFQDMRKRRLDIEPMDE